MKKKYLILIALLAAVALLTSAFVLLSPGAGEEDPPTQGDTGDQDGESLDPENTGDKDTGDDVENADGEDADDPDGETESGEEPDPGEALKAARLLETLGIMRGVGVNEDGTTDFDLEGSLTREQTAALIARTRGYSGSGEDALFPCPFEDVSDWALGAVGYLRCAGVVSGYSDTSFGGSGLVEGRELLSMALRSSGYGGDYAYENIMSFAAGLGLTDGRLGDGTEPIDRGDTAIILKNLLTLNYKNAPRTPLTTLTVSGVTTLEELAGLGLDGYATGIREIAVQPSYTEEKYAPLLVTVEKSDLMLNSLGTATGAIVGENLIVVPLEELRGAAYLKITDKGGNEIPYTGISYDQSGGVAYLSCQVAAPELGPIAAPGELETDLAYIYSGKATTILGPRFLEVSPGYPVMDCNGYFVGVTTRNGVTTVKVPAGKPVSLYELEKALWPDEAPRFMPRGIDPTKPMVAVTYDDGPSKAYTPQLLDILEEYDSVATFFECGYMLINYSDALQRMEDMGCEIGNHSYSHANLNTLSAAGIRDEIARTNDLIRAVVGHDATVIRAPYGNANATVKSAVDKPLIQWNVDTLDWQSRDATSVTNKVFANSTLDGYIILMHSLYSSTVTASRSIIPGLIDRGYQLVTVSELAYFRGVEMENGILYYSFKP